MSNKEKFEKLALERGYGWLYRNLGADEHELLVGAKGWSEHEMRECGYIFRDVDGDNIWKSAFDEFFNIEYKP